MGAACCIPSRQLSPAQKSVPLKVKTAPASASDAPTKATQQDSSARLCTGALQHSHWNIATSASPSPRGVREQVRVTTSRSGSNKSLGEPEKTNPVPAAGASSVPASPSWLSRTSRVAAVSGNGAAPASSASSRASSLCCSELAGATAPLSQALQQETPSPSHGALGLPAHSPACSLGRSSSSGRSSRMKSSKVSNDTRQALSSWDVAPPLMPLQEGGPSSGILALALHKGKDALEAKASPPVTGTSNPASNSKGSRLHKGRKTPRSLSLRAGPSSRHLKDGTAQASRAGYSSKAGLLGSNSMASDRSAGDQKEGKLSRKSNRSHKTEVSGGLGRLVWNMHHREMSSDTNSSRHRSRSERLASKSTRLSQEEADPSKLGKAMSFGQGKARGSSSGPLAKGKKGKKGKQSGEGSRAVRGSSGRRGSKKRYRALSGLSEYRGEAIHGLEVELTTLASGMESDWDWEGAFLLDKSRNTMASSNDPPSEGRGDKVAAGTVCAGCALSMGGRGRWRGSVSASSGSSSPDAVMVSSVLACGHVFHADCLDYLLDGVQCPDPPCPRCIRREKRRSRKKLLIV